MSEAAIDQRISSLIRELDQEVKMCPPYWQRSSTVNVRMWQVIAELVACLPDPDAELVERMASAMWETHRNKLNSPRWESVHDEVRDTFRGHAKTALAVHRNALANGRRADDA